VFKSSESKKRKGLSDISANVSIGTPKEENQQAIAGDCSENVCTISQKERTLPASQSYRNVGCSNSCQGQISTNTFSMMKPIYQSKIINIKTSNESASSADDSSLSTSKVMMKYQEAKKIYNFRNAENPSIHVSL
jgi:hypothetical protein